MIERAAETYWVHIVMSGPIDIAKQLLREECLREGLCVTIEPTVFIYTGGEETGFRVGFVNYPRFQTSKESILARARAVMAKLLDATHQHSAMLMTPETTEWVSKRPEYGDANAK